MAELNIISKDILTVDKGIIIHCCNSLSVLGAGLAKELKLKYPYIEYDYKEFLRCTKYPLGKVAWSYENPIKENKLVIANMITQSEIGTYKVQTNFDALRSCLIEVNQVADNLNFQVFAPHFMGAGLAGGPTQESKQQTWAKVSNILLEVCPEVIICKL